MYKQFDCNALDVMGNHTRKICAIFFCANQSDSQPSIQLRCSFPLSELPAYFFFASRLPDSSHDYYSVVTFSKRTEYLVRYR